MLKEKIISLIAICAEFDIKYFIRQEKDSDSYKLYFVEMPADDTLTFYLKLINILTKFNPDYYTSLTSNSDDKDFTVYYTSKELGGKSKTFTVYPVSTSYFNFVYQKAKKDGEIYG